MPHHHHHPPPKPPPTTVIRIQGFLDRQGPPKLPWIVPYVVDCDMAQMWDGIHGHPLTANNPLDQALAAGATALKLRASRAGGAPAAMKSLGGFTPKLVTDPANGNSTTVGPFWRADYLALYAEYQSLLAAKYDANVNLREVVMAEMALVYDEPFRQYGNPGYTTAEFQAAFSSMYSAHSVWQHTLSDLAFNPTSVGGNAFTLSQITAVRAAMGKWAVLGENSLQDSDQNAEYTAIYSAIKAGGAPIYFQTATMARMGDPALTFARGVGFGANSIELPSGYQNINASVLNNAQTALIANP